MAYPTISSLPPAPLLSDTPQDFDAKAVSFTLALDPLVSQLNAAGEFVEAASAQVDSDATQAAADRVQTTADAAATADDRVQTADDAAATAGDRIQTGQDRGQTGQDRLAVAEARDTTLGYRDEAQSARDEAVAIAAGDVAITDLQPSVWRPVSSGSVLGANSWYAVDFTSGPLTLTLPSTPSENDMIRLYKSAGESLDSIISRNGETIMGIADDLTLDVEITALSLVYNGSDWRIVDV